MRAVWVALLTGRSAGAVLATLPRPTILDVIPLTVVAKLTLPVKDAPDKGANKLRAVWVALLTGRSAGAVLATLPRPTIVEVMPTAELVTTNDGTVAVPKKVGLLIGAFKFTKLLKSL